MTGRARLLPIVIAVVTVALTLKLANIWLGIDGVFAPAIAESKSDEKAPAKKAGRKEAPVSPAHNTEKAKKPEAPAQARSGQRIDPTLMTENELEVLYKLRSRRTGLDKRESEIDDRENLLKAAESRIEVKISELTKIKKTIEGLLKKHDKQQEARLKSLVKIYESMKPKDAARIFEKLDMPILLDVIERMRESKTAPIMANMAPTKAKSVTTALVGRRALPVPRNSKSR